jgi:hypothetical protein
MSDQPPRDLTDFSAEDAVFGRRIFISILLIALFLLVSLALPSLRDFFEG